MILVATINMVVALLVLILERTQMIGILKAGANNWSIRKIFLYNASYLIFVDCCGEWNRNSNSVAPKYFGIIKLNPEKTTMSIRRPYI
jgi:lipoprotein-releasing system permease protein